VSVAVVFDSAGTLLRTYRVAKDIIHGELLPGIETTMLTFASSDRVLVVMHVHSQDIIDAEPDLLLSTYLVEHNIGFGISCTRRIITAEEVGDVLYTDRKAKIRDVQECIRHVWSSCRKEAVVAMNSGVILNLGFPGIEFTITTGGTPFEGAKEAVTELHRMGVPTYIASGDRVTKLEKMADHLGIPRDRVYGVATPSVKAQIVADLQEEYTTVIMVGDSINDLSAMKKADIAILTEEQSGGKPDELYRTASYVVKNVREVVAIVKNLKGMREDLLPRDKR
jgi:soluble P-type ATPase